MKWYLPAKTFLLGEYAALSEGAAILLTTTPCFELSITKQQVLNEIHQDSPAGLWWRQQNTKKNLLWFDPYQGQGGLGASSAQFLGSYLAHCYLKKRKPTLVNMLEAYYSVSWSKIGLRPSGYDVIAQAHQACVYINKQKKIIQSNPWPFDDLSFLLIHTGSKLATHTHLQSTTLPCQTDILSAIVEEGQSAFTQVNSGLLVNCINRYHQTLSSLNLVMNHSLKLINELRELPDVLAIKGCGALGADVLLILTTCCNKSTLINKISNQNLQVLATEDNLTSHSSQSLLKNSF
jgi:mevalonate kinase